MARKCIVCLDFDGVIHSYISGWQGAENIPDGPVVEQGTNKSSIQRIREYVNDKELEVCIYSARSSQAGGVEAMRSWLLKHGLQLDYINQIGFPIAKPPAHITIDDRAICFQGLFPDAKYLKEFKPWYAKPN